jgi:hypothetical protein
VRHMTCLPSRFLRSVHFRPRTIVARTARAVRPLNIKKMILSHVTPAGARTLSPNLTPVTAFKRGAGSMKRETQQLSGGQLTQFIIIKLRQYYERSPAFMAVFNAGG